MFGPEKGDFSFDALAWFWDSLFNNEWARSMITRWKPYFRQVFILISSVALFFQLDPQQTAKKYLKTLCYFQLMKCGPGCDSPESRLARFVKAGNSKPNFYKIFDTIYWTIIDEPIYVS
jgi:hypothetical protein